MKTLAISISLFLAVILTVLGIASANGADLQPIPTARRVVDTTNTLTTEQVKSLEKQLYDVKGKAVIAALIVPTTAPEDIFTYSMRVFDAWKLGRKDIDNGVLIMVAKGDRKIRITVGYGLEGNIPDARAKRIISDIMTPKLKAGDYYGALSLAAIEVDKLTIPVVEPVKAKSDTGYYIAFGAFLAFLVIIFLMIRAHRKNAEEQRERQLNRERLDDYYRGRGIDLRTPRPALIIAAIPYVASKSPHQPTPPPQREEYKPVETDDSDSYKPSRSNDDDSSSSSSPDLGSIGGGDIGGGSGGGGASGNF